MFTIKYGYKNSVGNDLFAIQSADKVVEHNTPAGTYVMLYRYPTTVCGDAGPVVETRIDLGGDFEPPCVFVENLAGKTVQRITYANRSGST